MAYRLLIFQIQLDATYIRLVGDCFGEKLEHNREADGSSLFDGLILSASDASLDRRNAVGGEQLFGLVFVQQRLPTLACGKNDSGCPVAGDCLFTVDGEARRLIQTAKVVAVAPHIAEHTRSG